jgi:hypothetical protein
MCCPYPECNCGDWIDVPDKDSAADQSALADYYKTQRMLGFEYSDHAKLSLEYLMDYRKQIIDLTRQAINGPMQKEYTNLVEYVNEQIRQLLVL